MGTSHIKSAEFCSVVVVIDGFRYEATCKSSKFLEKNVKLNVKHLAMKKYGELVR